MMLASAGGAAGPDLGDMDLLDLIELTRAVTGEDTTETGHESGAHDNRKRRDRASSSSSSRRRTSSLIGGRDHGDALTHRPTSQIELRTGRRGNDDHGRVVADPAAMPCDRTVAKIVDKALTPFEAGIADLERVDGATGAQLPGDPSTSAPAPSRTRAISANRRRSSRHRRSGAGCRHGHEP